MKRILFAAAAAVCIAVWPGTAGFVEASAAMTADGMYDRGIPTETGEETAETRGPAEEPVTMDVIYGYENTARAGRFLPLSVELQNRTETDLQGYLSVILPQPDFEGYTAGGREVCDTFRYEYPLELKSGETGSREMTLPLDVKVSQIFLEVTDRDGKLISRKRIALDMGAAGTELFIGLLSDHPGQLSYLDQMGVSYGSLRTRAVPFTVQSLPDQDQEMDQLDVLLVTDFDTDTLSQDQIRAVESWVKKGGILLIGTGERGEETLAAFEPELLSYTTLRTGVYELDLGEELSAEGPGGSLLPLYCHEIDLEGGSELITSGSFSLLSTVACGNGLVAASIYDFADLEEFGEGNPSFVDHFFTTLLGENRISLLKSTGGMGNSSRFWAVQGLISTGAITRLPQVGLYVTLAAAYVALAGPGLYFFLKQRELGRYYQASVAVLSVLCTGMVLLMGTGTRFKAPFFTYARIREAKEDEVQETAFVNMRVPYNKKYSVALDPSYSLCPVAGSLYYDQKPIMDFTGEDSASVTLRFDEDNTRIQTQNVGAFHSKYFQMERKQANTDAEGFSGEVHLFDGKVTGFITNHYSNPVENAALLLYDQLIVIGTMEPGETVSLDELEAEYGTLGFGYPTASRITGCSLYEQRGDIRDRMYVKALERTSLLSFYIENYLSSYHSQAHVVAFCRDQDEAALASGPYEAYGSTLLVSELPVDNEENGLVFRSAMRRSPNVISGEYDPMRNTIYGVTPVTLEYYLGNETELEKLEFHQVGMELAEDLRYYYTVPFTGTMSFYNYNTGEFDVADRSSYQMQDLGHYLSPGNTITVKYVYDRSEEYQWNIMLPLLTVTGRSK